MTQQKPNATYAPEKFQNAEQLWFWFIYSRSVQSGLRHQYGRATRRVCELVDVETLVTKLYYAGELTDEQLDTMKRFGDRRRAPHQHIWAENRAAALWRDAMAVLHTAAKQRGWIA